jgi:hypothetical protein
LCMVARTLIAFSSSSGPASAEIRYGTFRPTFLVTPRRSPVLAAKLVISALVGLAFGLLAEALMTADASIGFAARGIDNQLTAGDYVQLVTRGEGFQNAGSVNTAGC